MSNKRFPTPPVFEEKNFHSRNNSIVELQLKLSKGADLSYSEVQGMIYHLSYMRRCNREFNKKYGLHKEVA